MLPFSPSPSLRLSASRRLLLFLACLGLAPQPIVAASPTTRPEIESVRVGFDGHYRVGFWTPVEVAVRGGDQAVDARLIVAAPDGDGVRTEFTTKSFTIDADAERRVTAYVKFGRPASRLSVELVGDNETLDSRKFAAGNKDPDAIFHAAYPSTQAMVIELGNPIGLEAAIGGPSGTADRTNIVHLSHAGELPDEGIGYEGVESLVISSSPPGIDQALSIGSSRLAALKEWIEQGGRLVLAVGDDAPRLLAADVPLGRLLPGRIGEASKLARLTAIEAFGGATLPRAAARGRRDEVIAVRLLDVTGRIELADGSFPLVVRAPRVFGEVAFAAVDLSRPPLADWAGRRLFVKRLLRGRAAANRNEDDETATPPPTHLGLIDLSGQLRAALDQFRGVELAPFWLVAALAGVYIVLAGPADYFFLRTLGRRMALTWITFPLLVLLFCGGAYWAAHRLKSERLIVNQVDLVDIDAASQKVRGTTWFNLFSPITTTYDLSLSPHPTGDEDAPRQVWLSWQGLPGGALGGMEQTMAGPATVARGYESSAERDELRGVPVPVWATKSFVASWQTTCPPGIEARLRLTADDVAEGRLTSRLEHPLRDCLLIAGRWAWQLGELAPGQSAAIVPGDQRDLQALLKDFKLVREQSRNTTVDVEVSTPYNPAGFDVRSILRQMMFYDANSGRRYTGLLNRYQHKLDFSNHLALGQAVLWGAAAEPASEVRDHGRPLSGPDDQHWTFCRYLLPVAKD